MNLFFLLASFCYHDGDLFLGDDDEYYLNDDNYNFYADDDYGSGDDDFLQIRNVENLRRDLFTGYDKNTRPVIDYDSAVELQYGIEIESLDYFDQKAESIELNLNMIFRWTDEYLSWNLFDGGATATRVTNAKIELENRSLEKESMVIDIERNFNNAWDDYQNKLTIFQVQENNIITSTNNFNRTQEKYKLGQATSIEFRQAQLNLINSELNRNQAKYAAKIAELTLLQLSGELLNIEF